MTNVEALKDYYVKIGGSATDVENVTTISDMIEAITALSGGSSLPEVTAEDNGDVLTVVDGAWAKAAATSNVLVVNATTPDNTFNAGITLSNDMKNSDLEAAIESGKIVFIIATVGTSIERLCFQFAELSQGNRNFDAVAPALDTPSTTLLYRAYYTGSNLNRNTLTVNKQTLR